MDKTNDTSKSSSATPDDAVHQKNDDTTDDMLIFKNGMILGAISCDLVNINEGCAGGNKQHGNNRSINCLPHHTAVSCSTLGLRRKHSMPILLTSIDPNQCYDTNTVCVRSATTTIPNNINNSNCITTDLNTSLLDHSLESENNNYTTVNNTINNNINCNSNNIVTSDNSNININSNQIDLLNSSAISFESRLSSTLNRNKRNATTNGTNGTAANVAVAALTTVSTPNIVKSIVKQKSDTNHEYYDARYHHHPPQYTAIYFDAIGNAIGTNANLNGAGVGAGGIVSANVGGVVTANYYHDRSYDNNLSQMHHQHLPYTDLVANNIAMGLTDAGLTDSNQFGTDGNRSGGAVDVIPRRRGCFRQWFTRPSLPFVIGVLALGGVACTLGGIVLGSTGLVEHSTQYLSAALLMIGIGVSLLVISGAIWRLSIPDEVENCPCFRHLETCRNCNSPYCGNRLLTTHSGYMYPEFQHRPPPPSYVTSLNECTVGLLFHHEVANIQRNDSIRISTPPPAYRSSQSLSVFVPIHHAAVSPNQRSLLPELSVPAISSYAAQDVETSPQLDNNADLHHHQQSTVPQLSISLPLVISTVPESSSPVDRKAASVQPQSTDITIE